MSHPVDLLRRALAAEPARPLVTFYDDATGERVEFSAKTFDNWVVQDRELPRRRARHGSRGQGGAGAAVGHWQTAVWLFACWSADLTALPVGDGPIPEDADIVAAEPAAWSERHSARRPRWWSVPHVARRPARRVPAGVTDYAVEVRAYGDHFTRPRHTGAPAVGVRRCAP